MSRSPLRRVLFTSLFLVGVLTGCSEDSGESANCTVDNAREIQQSFIGNDVFEIDCGKVRVNTQFFFINNDETAHTATTQPEAPEAFDAELPNKGSTFAHTFTQTGEYQIACKRHQESMTLFVV